MAHRGEAFTQVQEIGPPGEQWPILATLGEFNRAAMTQAAEIMQALAAKIDDEGLRAGFLARVSNVLGKIS